MIDERILEVRSPPGPPSLPRLERVAWHRIASSAYRRETQVRPRPQVAVQITLAGCGAILDRRGAVLERLPPGRALLFVAARSRLSYGYPPDAREPYEFVYANLDGEAALAIAEELIARHGHAPALDPRLPIVQALTRLVPSAPFSHRRLALAESARLACELLAALVGANESAPAGEDALVDQAMAWMRARLAEPVAVAAAARACGVSREHLTRVFVRRCGEPPAAWLRRQRLRHAGILLRAGALRVADVAARCGFASASHFVQAFKAEAGVTPERFRRGG